VQLNSERSVSIRTKTSLARGPRPAGQAGIRIVSGMIEQEFESAFDAQTPIIENMVVGVPPAFVGLTKQLDKIVEQPLLGPRNDFPRGRKSMSTWPNRHILMRI
jgi:hypothetical protein